MYMLLSNKCQQIQKVQRELLLETVLCEKGGTGGSQNHQKSEIQVNGMIAARRLSRQLGNKETLVHGERKPF